MEDVGIEQHGLTVMLFLCYLIGIIFEIKLIPYFMGINYILLVPDKYMERTAFIR